MQNTAPDPGDAESNKRGATNRENSQHSRGPITEQGKRVSSLNALKFGFFSRKALLPSESWIDFEEFHNHLIREFAPHNTMEKHVFEQYVGLAWRIKRLPEIEAGIFARYGISVQGNQCGSAFAMVANVQTDDILGQLARYEATLRKNAFKYLDLFRTLRKDGWSTESLALIDTDVHDGSVEVSEEASADSQSVEPSSEPEFGHDANLESSAGA